VILAAGAGPPSLASVREQYLQALADAGLAAATIAGRRVHLIAFGRWALRAAVWEISCVTLDVLEAYRADLFRYRKRDGAPLARSTVVRKLSAVRLLLRWARRRGLFEKDPTEDFVLPRLPRRLPRAVLSAPQAERVLQLPDTSTPQGLRDRAMLEVLYSTGLRRGELVALGLRDIDPERGTVFVRDGKGARDRVVPIGRRALLWVGRCAAESRPVLAARAPLGPPSAAMFLNARGRPIRPTRLTDRFHRYVVASGVSTEGACHIFRHTMATVMHDRGADIRDLQEMLGHAELTSTEIYTHVSVERLRMVYARTHPAECEQVGVGEVPSGPVRRNYDAGSTGIRGRW
jgi:integrase/recombinase XerD